MLLKFTGSPPQVPLLLPGLLANALYGMLEVGRPGTSIGYYCIGGRGTQYKYCCVSHAQSVERTSLPGQHLRLGKRDPYNMNIFIPRYPTHGRGEDRGLPYFVPT